MRKSGQGKRPVQWQFKIDDRLSEFHDAQTPAALMPDHIVSTTTESTAPAQPGVDSAIARRFRGFLPVVVDVETGGFNSATDALLEIAAFMLKFDASGDLVLGDSHRYLVKPFPGSRLDPASLEITGIDPFHPLRPAVDEDEALRRLFQEVRKEVKEQNCKRAILVGHNSFFDVQFLNAAVERTKIKRNPFHPFSSFDTATLGGVAFGQTVLGRAVTAAGFAWEEGRAHGALYDAEMTARLFCAVVNRFRGIYENGTVSSETPAGSAEPAAEDADARGAAPAAPATASRR